MTTDTLRWGIVAPGGIARRFASQLPLSATGRLEAVASRDLEKARAFAEEFGAARAYGTYEELLADPEVDAIYIATVHTLHAEWVIKAAEAGKHVLCEKPLTTLPAFTMAAIDAARENGVVLVEGYMYRFHPQLNLLLSAIEEGAIGEVQHVEAAFCFSTRATTGRLLDPMLAGGGILDVGGYPVSFARAVARAAGDATGEPIALTARGSVRDDGVDEWATATLTYSTGMTAHVASGIRLAEDHRARVYGSKGVISLATPWVVETDATPEIQIGRVGEEPEVLRARAGAEYALEADAVAAAVAAGRAEVPEATWADAQSHARTLQTWREALGGSYPFESKTWNLPTVSGRPLRSHARGGAPMKYGRISGVDKNVSRLVMGCDNQTTLSHASVIFDDFFERGGNTFDTAFTYGKGLQEELLGQWMANRGVREEVVVITKGAHTPTCDPVSLDSELRTSLERMQIDSTDLYMMHRDNLEIPVGEFVDVLDEHYRSGRIGAFGGSNWSIERIDEANAYAAANDKQGFTILSNHFGLAEAYDLPWAGCRHATDPESKRWLLETRTPLFPWSSQARGFFSRANPDDLSDPQLVRCYYGDGNFERLRRATELGDRLGVAATAIALAYVLHQPFPTFPLFGPRTLTETRTSMDALAIELTPEQVGWLDLVE